MHQSRCGFGRSSARIAGPLSLGILAVGLAGLALEVPMAWVVFPVGYGAVLPLAIRYDRGGVSDGRDRPKERGGDSADEALARLRERYAAGEIDDAEFERRLEPLLESEDRTDF